MPLKKRFSKNLRLLCSSEPSYAHVARAIGVNRQQFNDYINGKSLPNETIINNLLHYFNIDIEAFFINDQKSEAKFTKDKVISIFKEHSYKNIKDGFYFIYYFFDDGNKFTNHKILRSLICVKFKDGITTFKRITKVNEFTKASKFAPLGKHVGVVLDIQDEIVFLGLNSVGYKEPTILVANSILSSHIEFRGVAFSKLNGYNTTRFAITKSPDKIPLNRLMDKVGVVNETTDVEINKITEFLRSE